MTIGARIQLLIDEREDLTQAELARRVGMSQGALNGLIRNGGSSKFLSKIARELRTTTAYLEAETEDRSEGALPAPTAASVADQLSSVLVPYYGNARHGMGGGALFDEQPSTEMIPMPRDWLRGRCSGSLDELMLVPGWGDSMEPTIRDGDVLLVDRAQRKVDRPDDIWAFGYSDAGYIKRLRADKRHFVVGSDNPKHPPWKALISEVHLVGRIISVMQWK